MLLEQLVKVGIVDALDDISGLRLQCGSVDQGLDQSVQRGSFAGLHAVALHPIHHEAIQVLPVCHALGDLNLRLLTTCQLEASLDENARARLFQPNLLDSAEAPCGHLHLVLRHRYLKGIDEVPQASIPVVAVLNSRELHNDLLLFAGIRRHLHQIIRRLRPQADDQDTIHPGALDVIHRLDAADGAELHDRRRWAQLLGGLGEFDLYHLHVLVVHQRATTEDQVAGRSAFHLHWQGQLFGVLRHALRPKP
mmetsp:Transcript_48608/g.114074  ORF Transcript_48608/g.114074 Transcript_48608/m.114074 type:complete len:251 (+) Transcript_48608:248-1000(+)